MEEPWNDTCQEKQKKCPPREDKIDCDIEVMNVKEIFIEIEKGRMRRKETRK